MNLPPLPELPDNEVIPLSAIRYVPGYAKSFVQEYATAYARAALAAQPGAVGDMVMVPKAFLTGFHTLAHNWSLEAIPPDYLWGTEKDVFKSTYRRCGHDLAKLKDLLAAAPTEAKPALDAVDALTDYEIDTACMHIVLADFPRQVEYDRAIVRAAISAKKGGAA